MDENLRTVLLLEELLLLPMGSQGAHRPAGATKAAVMQLPTAVLSHSLLPAASLRQVQWLPACSQ